MILKVVRLIWNTNAALSRWIVQQQQFQVTERSARSICQKIRQRTNFAQKLYRLPIRRTFALFKF